MKQKDEKDRCKIQMKKIDDKQMKKIILDLNDRLINYIYTVKTVWYKFEISLFIDKSLYRPE